MIRTEQTLVTCDPHGVYGAALTLLSCDLNQEETQKVVGLVVAGFNKLVHRDLLGAQQYVDRTRSTMNLQEKLATDLFRGMYPTTPSVYHANIVSTVVPRMLDVFLKETPRAKPEVVQTVEVADFSASLIENYMTEEQIKKECQLESSVASTSTKEIDELMKERIRIGKRLTACIENGRMTKEEFDAMIRLCSMALQNGPKQNRLGPMLEIASDYMNLFYKQENPTEVGGSVLDLLATRYRDKMFKNDDDEKKPG